MTGKPITVEARDEALAALLAGNPDALVAALGPDGFRVPMPASVGLAPEQVISVPADRATMIDVVVAADGMKMIATWERAFETGMAIGTVRTRNSPDLFLNVTIIDQRHRHGVFLALLTDPGAASGRATGPIAPSLLIPLRPRTASTRKSWNAIITDVDERTTRMLGWTAEQMVGRRSIEFLHPDDHERALANWMEMLSTKESQRIRFRHRCQDGSWLWVEAENIFHGAENTEDIVVDTQLSDISDEMAAHEALDRSEKLFRRLAESLPIGLLQLDRDGSLVYANDRLTSIFGVSGDGLLANLLAAVAEDDLPVIREALHQVLNEGVDHRELEIDVRASGGERRRCSVTLSALTDRDGSPGALACVNDITESARMREELKFKATFDGLTGCYNRASILAALEEMITVRDDTQVGVVFIDLDKFKPVNDTLGHAAGDELLVHTAGRLTGLLRDHDIVGRIGGDEFLLVCRDVDGPAEAMSIATRAAAALHTKVTLSTGEVERGASIGVTCSAPGATADELIAQADAAMYASKRAGLGQPILYDDTLDGDGPVGPLDGEGRNRVAA